MSLAIDTDSVSAVLLADRWHEVAEKSFDLDSYEFLWKERVVHGGGNEKLVCATGFAFLEKGRVRLAGSLSSVLAVRYIQPREKAAKGK